MSDKPAIDLLPTDRWDRSVDTGSLLNDNIARIEMLKLKMLELREVDEAELSNILHDLDILRGAFIQAATTIRSEGVGGATNYSLDRLPSHDAEPMILEGIIGQNKRIAKVLKIISRVAPTDLTILLEGETGSGKELFARIIHLNSTRSKFVAVNCGAFPANIIESELFGHVKGSFTGASGDRRGKFEEANSGTIFLDEIGDLELQAQVKLLRVLETGELQRVGSDKTYKVDVKVIAATHKNLAEMVKSGAFREDLYYRINMCPLWIPPLRERRDEIEILFEHFLQDARSSAHKKNIVLNAELRDFIIHAYDFPGNIRELKNMARYIAYIAGENAVTLHDLPVRYHRYVAATADPARAVLPEQGKQLDQVRASAEKDYLISIMEKHRGKIKAICKEMDVSRSRLYQLLSKFKLRAADYR